MAGYLGSKAVFLSTAVADIKGDLTVDGNVGIGTSSPDGQLHLFTSDASITPDADADDFIIEANGASGITIGSSEYSVGSIRFADIGSPRAGMIYYDHVGNSMRFYTAATEHMRIASSGIVNVVNGITFGSGTDVLDDYEEGTWTPSIVGEVTNGNGTYTKIGKVVTAHFYINLPNIGFSQDPGVLQGIPFTNNFSGNTNAGRSGGYTTYNTDGKAASLLFDNSTDVEFRQDPGGANLDRGTLAGNTYWGTLVYNTDS